MTVRILQGDCRDLLKTLPEASVHCIVTSPPYYGLRDYGVAGQMGLEESPEAFVAGMVAVFRECRRVLRDDGTLWLNMGDTYAGSGRGGNPTAATSTLQGGQSSQVASMVKRALIPSHRRDDAPVPRSDIRHAGYKPKDLMGMPWALAFALRADGWYLRQDIIWAKPNPMPESVRDRCTKAHEYLFLLSQSERYYYDQDAIAEPLAAASIERLAQPNLANQGGSDRVPGKTNGNMKAVRRNRMPNGWANSPIYHEADPRYVSRKPPRFGGNKYGDDDSEQSRTKSGNAWTGRETRNKRSVGEVATQPFKEAHFATFPAALIEPCILAGSPLGGMVLDPFGGAGTTGLVADRLQRNATLIELNPDYAAIARRRIAGDAPLLVDVA